MQCLAATRASTLTVLYSLFMHGWPRLGFWGNEENLKAALLAKVYYAICIYQSIFKAIEYRYSKVCFAYTICGHKTLLVRHVRQDRSLWRVLHLVTQTYRLHNSPTSLKTIFFLLHFNVMNWLSYELIIFTTVCLNIHRTDPSSLKHIIDS